MYFTRIIKQVLMTLRHLLLAQAIPNHWLHPEMSYTSPLPVHTTVQAFLHSWQLLYTFFTVSKPSPSFSWQDSFIFKDYHNYVHYLSFMFQVFLDFQIFETKWLELRNRSQPWQPSDVRQCNMLAHRLSWKLTILDFSFNATCVLCINY